MAEQDTASIQMRTGNPQEIAEMGEKIYNEKYRADFEKKHSGQFAAIDITSENAFVAGHPEEVLNKAKEASPSGVFHLIRIGSLGAFRVSYSSYEHDNWGFR